MRHGAQDVREDDRLAGSGDDLAVASLLDRSMSAKRTKFLPFQSGALSVDVTKTILPTSPFFSLKLVTTLSGRSSRAIFRR
jgi:hypothetical protein